MVVGMKKNLYLFVLIIFIVCAGLFYFNANRLPVRIGYIGSISGKDFIGFTQRYKDRFTEEPTHVAIFNYEAVRLIARGATVSQSLDPLKIKTALLKVGTFNSIQSGFSLDENGDTARPLYLHEIRNQTFTFIMEPTET